MPFADRIIQFMQTQGGERMLLVNDQECVMYRPDGSSAPVPQRLSLAQITSMLDEIMPDEARAEHAAGESVFFPYTYAETAFEVEVTQEAGTVRVTIGLPGERPVAPPVVEPEPPPPAPPPYTGPKRRPQNLDELFRLLKELEGSDLHLSSNEAPMVRVHGVLQKLLQYEVSEPEWLKSVVWPIVPERCQEEWERGRDSQFAFELQGVARFRCNLFADRHGPGAVFRLVPSQVVTAEEIDLPRHVVDLCFLTKGLVIVTGPGASGKSTTLAALVDHINKHRTAHVISIEDPIEFVHENIKCLINQREVGVHTDSFARALRAALRQDPDVCLVGEMRDLETVRIAIETAETGHLVFGTLNTTTTTTTVDRIIDQFPVDQQEQIRVVLSETLKAVIAQTLCRTVEGSRVAAWEILLVDPASANLIRENKTHQLASMMQIGRSRGCLTMNDSLVAHVVAGRVDPREAYLKSADKAGLLQLYEKAGIRLDLSAA
jgi:twitching motility protein PilT